MIRSGEPGDSVIPEKNKNNKVNKIIVRPAFTMGGTGGGICETREKLIEIGTNGLRLSPIHQILVEKCIAGWKEIEYEVMRDHKGNVITVCNMENLDPETLC